MTPRKLNLEIPSRIEAELAGAADGPTRERILRRELAFSHGRLALLLELAEKTQSLDASARDFHNLVVGVHLAADRFQIRTPTVTN